MKKMPVKAGNMKAEEIFEKSVSVMKGLLTPSGVSESLKRARTRSEGENICRQY